MNPSLQDINQIFDLGKKLEDICRTISLFYLCLATKRIGFVPVDSKNPAAVFPTISSQMVNYIISEIYPCKSFLDPSNELDLHEHIDDKIKEYLEETEKKIRIDPAIYNLINIYLSNLYHCGVITKAYEEESPVNYGYESNYQNCALQAIMYLTVAIGDWLELDIITDTEIKTAYSIVDNHGNELKEADKLPEMFHSQCTQLFTSKGYQISDEAIFTLAYAMKKIQNNKTKILESRVYGFCRPIV